MSGDGDPTFGKDTAHGDNLDVAADLQQKLNDAGLAEVQRRAQPETHPDFDGKHCISCGNEIPKLRLKLNKIRCVYCQEAKERRDRGY